MRDDELEQRLTRTLQAKAAALRSDDMPFDAMPTLELAPAPGRSRMPALVSAALVVVVGVGLISIVALRRDDGTPVRTVPTTTPTTAVDLTVRMLPGWVDIPDAAADGTVPVDRFNALLDAAAPAWATEPIRVALVLTHFPEDVAIEGGTVDVREHDVGRDRSRVTLTHRGLPDDSVAAERYEIVLARRADGRWNVVSAKWAQQCQPSRGHQEFTSEVCR